MQQQCGGKTLQDAVQINIDNTKRTANNSNQKEQKPKPKTVCLSSKYFEERMRYLSRLRAKPFI